MFSENKKISERQMTRLLIYDLLGLGTLLVPTVLGRVAGRDGIFCIVCGTVAGLLYLHLLKGIFLDMKGSFPEYLKEKLGNLGSRIVLVGYLVYFVLLAGYTAYLFTTIVLKNMLKAESFWLVLVLLLLLVFYGMWEGIEGRARVYEILFWVLLVPLFLMLFSALNEIEPDYWAPVFTAKPAGVALGSYYVFMPLSFLFFLLFLGAFMQKKERLICVGRRAVLFTGSIYAVLYLILLGIFGAAALGTMDFPAVTLMSTVKISGGFLKRTDAFMFGIWFFTLFALVSSNVFFGAVTLRALTGMDGWNSLKKSMRRERISALAMLPAVLVLAGIFYRSEAAARDYEGFLRYIGTPFLVLVPLVLAVRRGVGKGRKIGKENVLLAAIFISAGFISGCGTAELEERDFPIELAVKDTPSFVAAWLNAGQAGNRVLDYNHLKVLILEQDFLEDAEGMQEFLDFLEKKADVPRNTYVVAAENAEEIVKLTGGNEESIGNYLEQLFENVSEVKKKMYPTLGMLYQEKENHLETLFIPLVTEERGKPVVEEYYVWKRGQAAGKADNETAMLAFFTQNAMDAYTLLLKDGAIRLTLAHNEIRFSDDTAKTIVVEVHCNGEILYETTGETLEPWPGKRETVHKEEIRQRLECQAEDYMNFRAGAALGRGIDATNSYRKLGGYRRDWYFMYQPDAGRYEEEVQIVYKVQIRWVNL